MVEQVEKKICVQEILTEEQKKFCEGLVLFLMDSDGLLSKIAERVCQGIEELQFENVLKKEAED